ncbi:MFS transporter [Corynebacterium uberis]|uniref:MFS transporter n=1 Tax=Corynebacterium TaxID=1716 RepID=UPI001D0B46A8|nr:MFS transporter [Corynebacterium uberis]MCZ9309454.1 MFS transporter [Corynebacterium sp. c6VSa_13]UDL73003.1 MFS transporter [Corynebacterium uberis]UDL76120.1 MFS transporter [Corynebacterium uberis]UDL78332.1 MFS transporter [Corynebacterium uberis]UDL80615.1 MFS transporter [Corynebacterium uberis]
MGIDAATRNPFRHPDYRRWFGAETFSDFAASMSLATTLVLIEVTESISAAGIIASISSALALVATFLGGSVGDAYSRRRLLLGSGVVVTSCAGLLAVILFARALLPHALVLVTVIALTFIVGVTASFLAPILDAALKRLITPQEFPRAMSATQARSEVLHIVGSPVAGWLYRFSPGAPFVVVAVCQGIYTALLSRVSTELGPEAPEAPAAPAASGASKRSGWKRAVGHSLGGWHHLRTHPELFRLLWCAPLINIAVFGTMSWVVYQLKDDAHSSTTIGFVTAGFGVGALVGSALAPYLSDRFAVGRLVVGGLVWIIAGMTCLYLVPREPWPLAVIAAVALIFSPALNGALFGYVFAVTGEELQSRVIATFTAIAGIAGALAPLVASQAVYHHVPAVMGAGVAAVGFAGLALTVSSPQVRGIGKVGDWES